jgi:hypothetical protein
LRAFADANEIRYPLLSDVGGVVVDRYGLLNPNIPPNPRQAPGIPFPGQFLLSPEGVIVAKAFTGDLRHRVAGAALVFEQVGAGANERAGPPDAIVDAGVVRASITVSTNRLFGGQEFAFAVDVQIASGWHVYADPVPAPYTPLRVTIDPERVLVTQHDVTHPEPTWITFAATSESLPVHEGTIRLAGRARLRWSPPPSMFSGLEHAVARRAIAPGRYELRGVLEFQVCDDTQCLAPRRESFTLPIVVEPHVPPR